MPWSVARLLGPRRSLVTGSAAAVTVAAGAVFWVVASVIDAFIVHHRSLGDELLRPRPGEVWLRLLVAVLIGMLYVERRARAQLALLWFVLDEAPDGIQITDLQGRIAYSNRAVRDIYGFAPEQLRGRHVNDMNADPTFAERAILPELQRSGRWAGELLVKHADGHTFPIWLTTSAVLGRRGRPSAAVGIIRDISDRKRVEEDLRRYAAELEEATRLKDLFADILRHDLLGPASVLRVSIDMLRKQPLDDAAARLVAHARRSCGRLLEMLETAAKYARLSAAEELDFEPLDLRTVLTGVLADFDVLIADRDVHVVFDAIGSYPVRANRVVADVFANLVSNAIKYGPRGGTITIAIRDGGERWIVSVADEGPGIAPPDRERIFTRFERLGKEAVQGSGLGLAIARRAVELHRGSIWVEDAPASGAAFCVALPKG